MRSPSTNDLIAQLAQDPPPVQPMRLARGAIGIVVAFAVTCVAVIIVDGFAITKAVGASMSHLLLTNALLALLAIASSFAVLHMARPQAGARRDAPKWALAMIAVLPLVALVHGLTHGEDAPFWRDAHGPACLIQSMAAAALTMGVLIWWVRRGAPANPRLASAYIGMASGAMGALAYGVSCPIFDMAHVFAWHAALPILMSALAAVALPRLLRW